MLALCATIGAAVDKLMLLSAKHRLYDLLTAFWISLDRTSIADFPAHGARFAVRVIRSVRTRPAQSLLLSIPVSFVLTVVMSVLGRVVRTRLFPGYDGSAVSAADTIRVASIHLGWFAQELPKYGGGLVINWIFDLSTTLTTLILVAKITVVHGSVVRAGLIVVDAILAYSLAVACLCATYVGFTLLPWNATTSFGTRTIAELWLQANAAIWSLISISPTPANARDFDDAFFAATTLLPSLAYLFLLALAVLTKITMSLALRVSRYWVQLATEPLPKEVANSFQPFTLLGVVFGVLATVTTTAIELIKVLN